MPLTINGTYTYGLDVTDSATFNPISIGTSGLISGTGLFLGGSAAWTLGNSGTVQSTGTGTSSVGISLSAGGQITNTATGLIGGFYAGIRTAVAATLTNAGSIAATGTAGAAVLLGSGTVANAGGHITGGGTGVRLTGLGVVTNTGTVGGAGGDGVALVGGTVGNYGTDAALTGLVAGVSVSGAGTVINSGAIRSTTTAGGGYTYSTVTHAITPVAGGVLLGSGGVANAAGGTIGSYFIGVGITAGGSVENSGTILATGTATSFAVMLQGGGAVTNAAGGRIAGANYGIFAFGPAAATVLNRGTIAGTAHVGAILFGDGTVDNAVGALITSANAGVVGEGAVSVTNHGTIAGDSNSGIRLAGTTANVTNAPGAIVRSNYVGIWETSGGQISNAGSISAQFGMVFQANAGTATNDATGAISGTSHGIYMLGAAGTVLNSGTIVSAGQNRGAGIQLAAGGTATNLAGGYISAKWIGIQIGAGANNGTNASPGGTVVNSGTILANDAGNSGAAVWIRGNGLILNQAGGTITGGPYGIVSYDQVTVVNHGSIGGAQFAVFASNAGMHDLVVVHPGATFGGQVQGDKAGAATLTGTLELAAGTIAGSISGFGSKYTGFSNVIIDSGARWSLAGTVAASQTIALPGTGAALTLVNPGSVAGTITGFDATDTLTLAGITDVSGVTLGANNVVTVNETGGGTITLHFDPTQSFSAGTFNFATGAGGTSLTVPCFASGTRILTARGEVAVEALRIGDQVITHHGRQSPVRWVGHRKVDCQRHPRPQDVWPVRVRAGAFGPGLPRRDLLLSPDHAVFVDPVLVKVSCLLNDATIVQQPVRQVTYWHVELDRHDVLLAEGLPAESYLDTGNRSDFAGGGPALTLHPDFARDAWDAGACARLILGGPELIDARAALLRRALRQGWFATPDAAPVVLARGRTVLPRTRDDGGLVFDLPPDLRQFRLQSLSAVPARMKVLDDDRRRLGLAVARIAIDGHDVALDDERLGEGWHPAEAGHRWTDGDALVVARGARRVVLWLRPLMRYWMERPDRSGRLPHRRRGSSAQAAAMSCKASDTPIAQP